MKNLKYFFIFVENDLVMACLYKHWVVDFSHEPNKSRHFTENIRRLTSSAPNWSTLWNPADLRLLAPVPKGFLVGAEVPTNTCCSLADKSDRRNKSSCDLSLGSLTSSFHVPCAWNTWLILTFFSVWDNFSSPIYLWPYFDSVVRQDLESRHVEFPEEGSVVAPVDVVGTGGRLLCRLGGRGSQLGGHSSHSGVRGWLHRTVFNLLGLFTFLALYPPVALDQTCSSNKTAV